jgi:hypothetical protein
MRKKNQQYASITAGCLGVILESKEISRQEMKYGNCK